ncbi:hypothetical protein [Bacillus sp. B1-b2]|uniref:hypothetical protein n=1 Tax=Bacillus sp. B1-b2 TaxID=2653201 RepID=UPI0012621E3B|nr:hypothetical protein [Bacillus sp. B1-b2]KAB7671257.1 hypothetical protein F9279_07030 [Bacillus sp. B1-b2]
MKSRIGVHEVLELHELLTFKNVCLTKSTIMQSLVSDPRLKDIMKQDVISSTNQVKELKNHLS